MLQTKCIRSPIESADGLRVSVMSRHTSNDGVTPDPTISPDMFDDWLPILAPPPKLIGDYYKRGTTWEDFAQRYREHIGSGDPHDMLLELAQQALNETVTILCTETSPLHCHRRLLAEQAQIAVPGLATIIC